MKAAVVEQFGEPPRCVEVPEPELSEGQVLAQVRAAALKTIERDLAAGTHYASAHLRLPARIGVDAVVTLPDGRRVYAAAPPPGGAMAERIAVDPDTAVHVPDSIDDASAAALPNPGVSAWLALQYAGQMQAGQCVLVLGGTGVAGGLAAQLARRQFDANRVVVAGRNTVRLRQLQQLGCADTTIPIKSDAAGRAALQDAIARLHAECPFDLVLDYLWGLPAQQVLAALAGDNLLTSFHRTRYVQIGQTAGSTIQLPASVLRSAGIELLGQGGGSLPRRALARVRTEILPSLFTLLADGTIAITTTASPLTHVAQAWKQATPSGVRMVLTTDHVRRTSGRADGHEAASGCGSGCGSGRTAG